MGPLIVLSGPSGSGKSSVIKRLLQSNRRPLHLSVSATTRRPRPNERDGVDYYFWTPERFESEIQRGGFIEWAQVHTNFYGTLFSEVDPYREQGVGVLLDIDVQGAKRVLEQCPDSITVFLKAPSWEAYEQRLRARGTETEESIQRRLETGRRELDHASEYQHVLFNDDLDEAVGEFSRIVEQAFQRSGHAR